MDWLSVQVRPSPDTAAYLILLRPVNTTRAECTDRHLTARGTLARMSYEHMLITRQGE
jgi:hypothetical protein